MSESLRRLVCLFVFTVLASAQGELVLTNFSSTKPIKIMPIGDSITDDCSVNGAWRLYLQPLLQSTGYPFTFVGRQASSPVSPSFTKVNHEGYCGAVIAPPGVFAVHNYSQTNAYLLKIVADALAVTNNRPDIVLLLIGANDIGRGRDPYQVATNDMARLLDLIFTNVPNANIILAKITSLQSAGLNYGQYAANVPIYNAALQALVNQRQATGQRVFLADMFTTVDYASMFMSDHVHPNTVGLKAMANEWLTRIRSITTGTNRVVSTLVHGGDWWNYYDSGQDLGTNWATLNYDDSQWNTGAARLGYGDPTVATGVGFGPDPTNKYITTYIRHTFTVPSNLIVTNLNVRLARTGGAVVWLNGQELFRTNLAAGLLTYTNLASSTLTMYTSQNFYPLSIPVPSLPAGTNLIAVEAHLASPTNSVLGFDMELIGTGYVPGPPLLSITQAGQNLVFSWPMVNGAGFSPYSATEPFSSANWSRLSSVVQTNSGQLMTTQAVQGQVQFFRLQKP